LAATGDDLTRISLTHEDHHAAIRDGAEASHRPPADRDHLRRGFRARRDGDARRRPARSAPESFADLAEEVTGAVVNISATTTVEARNRTLPQLPQGTPFEDLFEEFFNRRGQGGQGQQGQRPQQDGENSPRQPSSAAPTPSAQASWSTRPAS
jgi:S1-C subfamily serine protease